MLMVSISLVMAVTVTNIYLRKDGFHRVPFWVRKIFIGKTRMMPQETKLLTTIRHENHTSCDGKMQDFDVDTISTHSEVETCRARCCQCHGQNHVQDSQDPYELNMRTSLEWQILAKNVDRLFFWIFFISSIAALTAMFAQIPGGPHV